MSRAIRCTSLSGSLLLQFETIAERAARYVGRDIVELSVGLTGVYERNYVWMREAAQQFQSLGESARRRPTR
jgi:hypothetical protein